MIHLHRTYWDFIAISIDPDKSESIFYVVLGLHILRWRILFGKQLPAPNEHKTRWWLGPLELEISKYKKHNVKRIK
jgi:hypothetical protein